MSRVNLTPPRKDEALDPKTSHYLLEIFERLGEGPFLIQGYSADALPDAAQWASTDATNPFGSIIWVYDDVGGACFAGSDGTNWKRIQLGAIVSST